MCLICCGGELGRAKECSLTRLLLARRSPANQIACWMVHLWGNGWKWELEMDMFRLFSLRLEGGGEISFSYET